MTMRYLLRRHFGPAHLDVEDRGALPCPPWDGRRAIQARDLRLDLKVYPWARSVCGVRFFPYVDFEENQDRLIWYTFLREPVRRYVSNYYFEAEVDGDPRGFAEWMDDPDWHNLQVVALAGKPDLEAAKEMLEARFRCVGLVEHFDESLLIVRRRLGLRNFDVSYGRPRNTAAVRARSESRLEVKGRWEEYRPRILERNELDLKLYEYVTAEIWPRQVSEYGRAELAADVQSELRAGGLRARARHQLGFLACMGYRNLVYKPIAKWDKRRCWRRCART